MKKETSTEMHARLKAGHCCWHCRYYIRPNINVGLRLSGAVTRICTVERETGYYQRIDEMNRGDKDAAPDFYCDLFEMDLPPTTEVQE